MNTKGGLLGEGTGGKLEGKRENNGENMVKFITYINEKVIMEPILRNCKNDFTNGGRTERR
jgi:hypothetical protein